MNKNYYFRFLVLLISFLFSVVTINAQVLGSIGDDTYYDNNNNGICDGGDSPAPGLTVILCDANGNEIARQTTNSQGKYRFNDLPKGCYKVKFPSISKENRPLIRPVPTNGVGVKDCCLTEGQNTIDCDGGYSVGASISGLLYSDNNKNGIFDIGDSPVTDVSVSLCDANDVTLSRYSVNNDGTFKILFLSGGSYKIKFPTVSPDGKTISSQNPLSVTLTENQQKLNCNATYNTPSKGSVSGKLYCDNNNNGIFDNGDVVAAGVTVELINGTTRTATTDSNGDYSFTDLPLGSYKINYPSTANGKPLVSTDMKTVTLTVLQPDSEDNNGRYFKAAPKGSVSGKLYCDNNNNGIFDNGDVVAAGVTVELINGTTRTATTDSNGDYSFTDLPLGSYKINYPSTANGKPLVSTDMKTVTLTESQPNSTGNNGRYFKAPEPVCNPIFDPNKCYKIVNKNSGLVIDVANNSKYNDAPIIQNPFDGTGSQQWKIISTTSGYVKLVNVTSGKTLACHQKSLGSRVYQYDFYTGGAKEWKIECTSNGSFKIFHRLSGKVLQVRDGNKSANCPLEIDEYDGNSNEQWQIEAVPCYNPAPVCNPKITFCNLERCDVDIYYYDDNGRRNWSTTLNSNKSCNLRSYKGQKWQVCNRSNGRIIYDYTCNSCTDQWCNIKSCKSNGYSWLISNEVFTIDGRFESGRTQLNWINNTGYKNDYFTLQRLDNTTGEFQDLKTVNAIAESNELQYFKEYDDNPLEGENTYRIKVAYWDGTFDFTQLKVIKSVSLEDVRLFPNPAVDNLDVNLSGYEGKTVQLTIYNTFGKLISLRKVESVGKDNVHLDVSNLAAGTYLLRISSEGKKDMAKKFFIQ
jgi:SdrD B-like domain/Ricin-type beta-trefoil lectin domain-like/Secretion system C-terminal sorting domain